MRPYGAAQNNKSLRLFSEVGFAPTTYMGYALQFALLTELLGDVQECLYFAFKCVLSNVVLAHQLTHDKAQKTSYTY